MAERRTEHYHGALQPIFVRIHRAFALTFGTLGLKDMRDMSKWAAFLLGMISEGPARRAQSGQVHPTRRIPAGKA